MGRSETGRMDWCSKRGIVKTSESPADDQAGHTADCSSIQSPSFHPCFTLPGKGSFHPASPHVLLQIKELTTSFVRTSTQLHTCFYLHISTTSKIAVHSHTLISCVLIQCNIQNRNRSFHFIPKMYFNFQKKQYNFGHFSKLLETQKLKICKMPWNFQLSSQTVLKKHL